jgi:hypothetical protein
MGAAVARAAPAPPTHANERAHGPSGSGRIPRVVTARVRRAGKTRARPACATGSGKIEVSSLAPKHVINSGELRLPIRPLYSNQAKRLYLRHNSCFIFLFDILLH